MSGPIFENLLPMLWQEGWKLLALAGLGIVFKGFFIAMKHRNRL